MLLERARIIAHIDRLLGVGGKKLFIKKAGRYYLKSKPDPQQAAGSATGFKHFKFWLRVEEHWEQKETEEQVAADRERDADAKAAIDRNEVVKGLVASIKEDIKKREEANGKARGGALSPPPKGSAAAMALDSAVAAGAAASAAAKKPSRRGSTSGR